MPLLAGGVLATAVLTSASGPLAAQQVPVGECTASVAFVKTASECPSASLKFRIAVPNCAASSGTFAFSFMRVGQSTKVPAQVSGRWSSSRRVWDHAERVPLACDEKIYDVEVDPVISCTCQPVKQEASGR